MIRACRLHRSLCLYLSAFGWRVRAGWWTMGGDATFGPPRSEPVTRVFSVWLERS